MEFWCQWSQWTRLINHHAPLDPELLYASHTWFPAPLDSSSQHAPACPHIHVKFFSYWSQSIKYGRGDCIFICIDTDARILGSWRIRETLSKEHSKLPITNPKETEIHELPEKEFKIFVLKMLRELQNSTDKQLSKIRKKYKNKMRSSTMR